MQSYQSNMNPSAAKEEKLYQTARFAAMNYQVANLEQALNQLKPAMCKNGERMIDLLLLEFAASVASLEEAHQTAAEEIIKLLLGHGANVLKHRYEDGKTALILVAEALNVNIVKILVEHKPSREHIDARDRGGKNALFAVCISKHFAGLRSEIASVLLPYANLNLMYHGKRAAERAYAPQAVKEKTAELDKNPPMAETKKKKPEQILPEPIQTQNPQQAEPPNLGFENDKLTQMVLKQMGYQQQLQEAFLTLETLKSKINEFCKFMDKGYEEINHQEQVVNALSQTQPQTTVLPDWKNSTTGSQKRSLDKDDDNLYQNGLFKKRKG